MANNIDWGQGANKNVIGWGQGAANNDISWGSAYSVSWSGETDIIGNLFNEVKSILNKNNGSLFLPILGNVYTDTEGTTLAEVGDKVALIKCYVGSGKTGVQSNSANRAVLRVDIYGNYYLDPNGANCYYITDCTGSGVSNATMIGRGFTTGSGKIYAGCFRASDSSRSYFGARDTNADAKIGAGMDGVQWSTLSADETWTTDKVVAVTRSETQAKLYVNNSLVDTETISGVGSPLNAYLMAGNFDGTANDFWVGRWYGLVGALATLNIEDISLISTYLNYGNNTNLGETVAEDLEVRALADSGVFEAEICLENNINNLNNI